MNADARLVLNGIAGHEVELASAAQVGRNTSSKRSPPFRPKMTTDEKEARQGVGRLPRGQGPARQVDARGYDGGLRFGHPVVGDERSARPIRPSDAQGRPTKRPLDERLLHRAERGGTVDGVIVLVGLLVEERRRHVGPEQRRRSTDGLLSQDGRVVREEEKGVEGASAKGLARLQKSPKRAADATRKGEAARSCPPAPRR